MGYLGQIRDLSAHKMLLDLKKTFMSSISHDLRTPVTSIKGSLDLIQEGIMGSLSQKGQKLLSLSNKNCDRLLGMINEILDIEKSCSFFQGYEMTRIPLNILMQKSIDANRGYAQSCGIKLVLKRPKKNIYVSGNLNHLLRVLDNLLSNAFKFSSSGQNVLLEATELPDQKVRIKVKDKGKGISQEFMDKLFDSYTQENTLTNKEIKGSGLGLCIAKHIIRAHDSDIHVDSHVGKGSVFYFDLQIYTE